MPDVGDAAPDFDLIDQNKQQVTLSQFRGSKNVVLSFHVASFTGGWTDQTSSFRASGSKFGEKDTQVLGISTDAPATQTAWSVSLGNVSFPILSDFHPHGEMTKSYGLYNEEKGTAFRSIVIVDKEGVIRFRRVYTSAADIHMDDILAEVDKLQASS